jgi:hypothetical protein
MTERSDIRKYSIVNRQYSIPVYPGWAIAGPPAASAAGVSHHSSALIYIAGFSLGI